MPGIVVGIDGSKNAQIALAVAAQEALAHGETLRVVYAYPVSRPRRDLHEPLPANVELRRDAEDLVAREIGAAQLDERIDVVHEVVPVREHSVARALLHASKGASMLVVGSRGLEGFTGLLVGSVSQQVVGHADCPVLVVPGADARGA